MKSMRSADKDEVPKKRNHKSLPYGAGKERRLSQAGKVKKVLQNGNFGGFLGNSNSKKNISDVDEAQVFSEVHAKPVAHQFSKVQTKPSNAAQEIYMDKKISERANQ